MKLIGKRQTFVAVAVVLAASCTACNQHGAASNAAAARLAKPGPEESFKFVMETFNRRVEETPIGFVVSGGSSRSSMVGTNEVTSQLIAPTQPGETYKAIVTVTSKSRYALTRKTEASDDSDQINGDKSEGGNHPLTGKTDKSGVEILDPSLIRTPAVEGKEKPPTSGKSPDIVVGRRPDEEVRKYELRYENGRWTLLTKLDQETERAIQNAFDQALGTQF